MNVAMWGKAVNVIPRVSKDEWDALDVDLALADRDPLGGAGDDVQLRPPSPACWRCATAASTWCCG